MHLQNGITDFQYLDILIMPPAGEFMIGYFREVGHIPMFHQQCMTAKRLAALINKYYIIDTTLSFTGKELVFKTIYT